MRQFIFLASLFLLFSSCSKETVRGSGPTSTEERTLTGFTGIYVNGSTPVHIQQGTNFRVAVKGYSNILPYIKTAVLNGGTLEIGLVDGAVVRNNNAEIFITMPVLQKVRSNGSADVAVNGLFKQNVQEAELNGSGSIEMNGGEIVNFSATLTGSGKIKAFGLLSTTADVRLSGSGTVQVTASVKLKANLSGSGEIQYKGHPGTVESFVSGSGKVVKKD